MELADIKVLPLVIRTGKFYSKKIPKGLTISSKAYGTPFYPKKKLHKPIIF
jgi:sirohydrochlorin ferrochelatase